MLVLKNGKKNKNVMHHDSQTPALDKSAQNQEAVMTQQCCDIENQCQHFCVYKQMVCPVYIRCASSTQPEVDSKILADLVVWSTKHNSFDGASIRKFIERRRKLPSSEAGR